MLNIPTKVDGVDVLSATEFNSSNDELKNSIESSGQTLAGGDLFQIAKMAAFYAGSSTLYVDSGTTNSYVLSAIASFKAVDAYSDGLLIRFISITANTGATTVNVNSIGVKSLVSPSGTSLISGDLPLGRYVEARYDTSNDHFILQKGFEDVSANTGKNLFINSDFSVAQRGTSHSTEGYGSLDRYRLNLSGATATLSQETHTLGQSDVPGSPKFFCKLDVTTGADFSGFLQRIEGVNRTSDQAITVSFFAKGTNPGGGNITLRTTQSFGTGGSPSAIVNVDQGTFVLTSSFKLFTFTFTPASITGKTLGTDGNDYLQIFLTQGTDTSTAAWDISVSELVGEFGEIARKAEIISPDDNLAKCQRYFEKSYNVDVDPGTVTLAGAVSWRSSGVFVHHPIDYRVTKRDTPDVTIHSTAVGTAGSVTDVTLGEISGITTSVEGSSGFRLFKATGTADQNEVRAHWVSDAEL